MGIIGLKKILENIKIPVLAIGGINHENHASLLQPDAMDSSHWVL